MYTCFVCYEDYRRHPAGLGKYKGELKIGIIDQEVRRMSAPPQKPTLVLKKETPTHKEFYCPNCFISVTVLGKTNAPTTQ